MTFSILNTRLWQTQKLLWALALTSLAAASAIAESGAAAARRAAPAAASAAPAAVAPAAGAAGARPAAGATAPASAPRAGESDSFSTADVAALLGKTYEERARAILERYIPTREFQVSVTINPSAKPLPRAPYEPKAVTSAALANLPSEELAPYISNITFELAITQRLAGSRKKLEELLFRGLKLNATRGDRVQFLALGIEVENDEWKREKGDLKQELSLIKSENDKLNRELAVLAQQLKNAEREREREKMEMTLKLEEEKKKEEEVKEKKPEGVEAWLTEELKTQIAYLIGGIAAVLFLGILFFGRSVMSAGKNLGGALTTIAKAMENVGGTLANPNGEKPEGGITTLEGKLLYDGGKDAAGGGGGAGKNQNLSSLPIDSLQAHLLKVRHELLENLNDGTESVILRHLTQLCATPATVGRAVGAMELLGRDTATNLFRRMGLQGQEAVLKFLREGTYDRPKVELMLEAAEELKTKLLVESFDRVRGKPSEKIAERLIQLNDEEMAQVALAMDPKMIPRLFLYLAPPKIAAILAALKSNDTSQFERTISVLSSMPEAEQNEGNDDAILRALDVVINRTKADAQRPFLKVYQEIVELSDDDIGETIVRELSSDPRLDEYFRENIINIHTFFKLTEQSRAEIIEALSNKDVAALATGVDEDERDTLFGELPARREALIMEEYDSLVSRGGRNVEVAFKKVRDIVVKRLKDMKNQGLLSNALNVGEDDDDDNSNERRALEPGGNFGGGDDDDEGSDAA